MRIKLQMKEKRQKTNYSVGFIYTIILCSMLSVFPLNVGGMDILPVILFLLCILWMATDIWQINRGKKKPRSNYRRLDIMVVMLLVYELGLIAFSMMQKIEENEPEPDYSWKLLIISLALLYLLIMEAGEFRTGYLDMVLYGGLVVMALLLLGYLFAPQVGELVYLWENHTAAGSYLLMIGLVGALQYCRCKQPMRRIFYAMCAGLSFFLLACNHSVISFWIMTYALLSIPILIRPTAVLCKNAMQMLFLFLVIISSMGLLANNTGLLLVTVNYDVEHCVCLDMVAAAGALVFFYCWYRKPDGVTLDKIVMRGFYKLDKLVRSGMLIVLILFAAGGAAWETLDGGKFGVRAVSGFAKPLLEEAGKVQSLIYLCLQEQGLMGAFLCIVVLVLLVERVNRIFGWDQPMKGVLCVIAVSLLPQILIWEIVPNILPVAVVLVGGILGSRKQKGKKVPYKNRKGEGKKMSWLKKKKWGRGTVPPFIMTVVVSMVLCFATTFPVQANDAEKQLEAVENELITGTGQIVMAVGEVDARETPDMSAPVVITYHDGDNIFVIGETADGWYQVKYQELVGYVPAEQVKPIELDVAALDDEFAIEAEEGKLVVEEVERQRTELRRSKIWGAVIVLLVLGVFVTGIISTVRNGEKESEWE